MPFPGTSLRAEAASTLRSQPLATSCPNRCDRPSCAELTRDLRHAILWGVVVKPVGSRAGTHFAFMGTAALTVLLFCTLAPAKDAFIERARAETAIAKICVGVGVGWRLRTNPIALASARASASPLVNHWPRR